MNIDSRISLKTKLYTAITWILVGLVLLSAVYFSSITNFEKLCFSQRNNYICELHKGTLQNAPISGDVYCCKMPLMVKKPEVIKYIRIKAKGIKRKAPLLTVSGIKENGEVVFIAEPIEMKNGYNVIPVSIQNAEILELTVEGLDYRVVNSGELRQSVESYSLRDAGKYLFIALALYIAITLAIAKVLKLIPKRTINARSRFLTNVRLNIPDRPASWCRTIIWFFIISNSYLLQIQGETAGYKDHCMPFVHVELILVLLLAILINDKKHPNCTKRIDLTMLSFWMLYATYTFIADLLVDKIPRFAGVEVFIVFTAFAYFWASKEIDEDYMIEFENSIHLFLLFLVVTSLSANKEIEILSNVRYSGPFTNPSIYALYLASLWAILQALLEGEIRGRKRIFKVILLIIEIMIVGVLLISTQSLTPIIAICFVTLLFVARCISRRYGTKTAVIITCLGILVIIALGSIVLHGNLITIMGDSRIAHKFKYNDLTAILSGRDYYYRCYLREMNLFGHGSKPYLATLGKKILPHNMWIGQAYVYGVPIIVPFFLLMIKAVEKAVKYARNNTDHSAIPLYAIVSFLVMGLADNVDRYFIWLPWITCYMMFIPILFYEKETEQCGNNENEHKRNSKKS